MYIWVVRCQVLTLSMHSQLCNLIFICHNSHFKIIENVPTLPNYTTFLKFKLYLKYAMWCINVTRWLYWFDPSSPHDALKHHFTFLKSDLLFLWLRVLEWKLRWNLLTNTWQFSLIFHPHQIIFTHYKSRIATAILGLQWVKMTMVNSGFKGLKLVLLDPYIFSSKHVFKVNKRSQELPK